MMNKLSHKSLPKRCLSPTLTTSKGVSLSTLVTVVLITVASGGHGYFRFTSVTVANRL